MTDERTEQLGKLICTHDGRCRGPRYGQVYTCTNGGYVAGYRTHASRGLGLIGRKWFKAKKSAEDYAVQCSDI